MNNKIYKLNTHWITGFTDAEGCFYIILAKNEKCKIEWRVQACFQIGLHIRDKDLILFKNIVELMTKNKHLNEDDLIKTINLKASLNNGLSDELKINFPNVIKLDKPKVIIYNDINYDWIAGFFSGEGCFFINICKAVDYRAGYSIKLQIKITQHTKDKLLMNSLVNVLECGNTFKHYKDTVVLMVSGIKNMNKKIIPLFNKYKIEWIRLDIFI